MQACSYVMLGIGIGIFIQRAIITLSLNRFPSTICDYCEWSRAKKQKR